MSRQGVCACVCVYDQRCVVYQGVTLRVCVQGVCPQAYVCN